MHVVGMYLAKALEMDEQSANASTQLAKDTYAAMAVHWRNLAARVQADMEAFDHAGYSYDN